MIDCVSCGGGWGGVRLFPPMPNVGVNPQMIPIASNSRGMPHSEWCRSPLCRRRPHLVRTYCKKCLGHHDGQPVPHLPKLRPPWLDAYCRPQERSRPSESWPMECLKGGGKRPPPPWRSSVSVCFFVSVFVCLFVSVVVSVFVSVFVCLFFVWGRRTNEVVSATPSKPVVPWRGRWCLVVS